ncbi:MAG: zinc-ribbon domain-containing protein [Armatimonadetes bacterium]|nr:zinc-ribbon domain-containing protein [Armatimonadota bacterium]
MVRWLGGWKVLRRVPGVAEPPNYPTTGGTKMRCPRCGKENPPGARFCAYCGGPSDATGGSAPARGRVPWLAIAALVLILLAVGGTAGFLVTRSRSDSGGFAGLFGQPGPRAGDASAVRPGVPESLPPSPDEIRSPPTDAPRRWPWSRRPPGNAPSDRPLIGGQPGNVPQGEAVTPGTPGTSPGGPPLIAGQPGNVPGGQGVIAGSAGTALGGRPLIAGPPGNMMGGLRLPSAPPGNMMGGPRLPSALPGNKPEGRPLSPQPPAPPARDTRIDAMVAEYLRRLQVIEAEDGQIDQQIMTLGGSMLGAAYGLDELVGDQDRFTPQYRGIMSGFNNIAQAKMRLRAKFQQGCGPIARVCPPVQLLHRTVDQYFIGWIQAGGKLEGAMSSFNLGLVAQAEGELRAAKSTGAAADGMVVVLKNSLPPEVRARFGLAP